MRFWKMHGAGNDFIIINNLEEHIPENELPELARIFCRPHLSLGADGFMVADAPSGHAAASGRGASSGLFQPEILNNGKSDREAIPVGAGLMGTYSLGSPDSASVQATEGKPDFRLRFYNADGSVGEMCGNGARCICRYAFENGLSGPVQRIETTAGIVTGERISKTVYRVKLNNPSVIRPEGFIQLDGKTYSCAYAELGEPGVPHAVIPWANLRETDPDQMRETARQIRFHPDFPKGANVNFYEKTGENTFFLRTFERGVEDFTLACGTGTASTAAVLILRGEFSGTHAEADMSGGHLSVDIEQDHGAVTGLYLTGPAVVTAKGELFHEE